MRTEVRDEKEITLGSSTTAIVLSLFWAHGAHTQLNPFYHPFYPDVTHVRKDTRLSPLFRTARDERWAGPGNKARFYI